MILVTTFHFWHFTARNVKNLSREEVYRRNTNRHNIEKFREQLISNDWRSTLDSFDADSSCSAFIETLMDIFNCTCPLVKVIIKSKEVNNPWMTNALRNSCKKKQTLYRKYLRTKLDVDCTRYKQYKNKLTSVLRKAKQKHYHETLHRSEKDSKGTWRILNTLLNKIKNTKPLFPIV